MNTLRAMSWQLAADKKAPKPEPILLPGMADPGKKQVKGGSYSIEEMNRLLGWDQPGR